MQMIIKDITLEYRLLPICLNPDGTTTISFRVGYVNDNNEFKCIDAITITASVEATESILDAPPIEGLTRRQDLVFAIFNWCKDNGHIDANTTLV